MPTHDAALTAHKIHINGEPYVAGLYWQTLRHAVTYRDEAKALGKQHAMHAFTIRKTPLVIQAGFAPENLAPCKGVRSLAAALACVLGDNWIGAFMIDADTFAMVAVLDGGIMPGRDIVGSRAVVLAMLHDTLDIVDASSGAKCFERRIAPVSLGFGGEDVALRDLLRGKALRAAPKLRPITFTVSRREIITWTGACMLLLLASGATLVIVKARREAAALAQAEAELAAARQATAEAPAPSLEETAPWSLAPSALAAARACDHALDLPLSLAGWTLNEGRCIGEQVLASYARRGAQPLADFRAEALALLSSDVKAHDNGESATVAGRYIAPPPDLQQPLGDFDATVVFASYFQQRGIPAQLTGGSALEEPADTPPRAWKTYAFSIQSELAPSRAIADLALPGLRVRTITMNIGDVQQPLIRWTIAGDLYVFL
ncbi:type 4b pilus protein PilO2 [Pinirhizobacter soli]|uniref:type 4b pilus protein PilO2 n=1 Tax=Pinirhizobacter soli TaxID=2786953 RepID=UPI00202A0B84|nr:type 4b pilus protein PilO2 [Pinirhizobacter soli]